MINNLVFMIVFMIVFMFSLGSNFYLINQNSKLKYLTKINNEKINLQNETIKQMSLDSEKYKCSLDDLENYTKEKYKKIKYSKDDESCEAKLKDIEASLHIFNN